MNNVTVEYYLKASNTSGVTSYLPANAPDDYFQFTIGPDVIPPVMSFNPIETVSLLNFPITLNVGATDNQGIASVVVTYNINNGSESSFALSDLHDGTFTGTFPIDSSDVVIGDKIYYKITATDIAATPNSTTLPSDGSYYICEVSAFQAVSENFDDNDGGFTATNDWQWGSPATPPGAYSAPNVWGTVLSGDYSNGTLSQLQTPQYAVFGNNPKLTFRQWYDIESGFDGGNLKISVNGNPFQIVVPVNGYDDVISTNWGNPLGGEEAFTGNSNGWKEVTFDFTGVLSNGDEVVFSFDFGSDESLANNGWFIDNFTLTDIGSTIVGVENDTQTPNKFALSQNYPNPFNPTTTIRYSIPSVIARSGATRQSADLLVQLKVYDVLGREVATLVNRKQAPGNYSVKFDASKLTSGVYFYKLQSGSFVVTKKMILMK
jgi:hypothetical protein